MDSAVLDQELTRSSRVRRFENRIAITASGGKLVDGWLIAAIGIALPLATKDMGFGSVWQGLLGSSALIGIFIGGLVFGWVTDVVGRQTVLKYTLATFVVVSVLQFFVTDVVQLSVLRLLMGVAIGADFAVAGPMIAEFTSKKRRGPALAGLITWWFAGFSLASVASLLFLAAVPDDPGAWRWILASAALPALVMMIARIGLPESPRWLIQKGRREEAARIAEKYLNAETQRDIFSEEPRKVSYMMLFRGQQLRKTLLCSVFWAAQVTPFYAIYTFLPFVVAGFNITIDDSWVQVGLYGFLLIGSFVGQLLINKVGRRAMLIWPFFITGVVFLVMGIWPEAPVWLIITGFMIYAFFSTASQVLQMLYPSELFPTELRASGVGFAAAMSRIGSAIGVFLIPIILTSVGIGPVMLMSAGILGIGLLVSVLWAPETTNLELTEATGTIRVAQSVK